MNHKEHLSLSFTVQDSANQEEVRVHQAFVCLTHLATGAEIQYLAEAGGADANYKFDLDLAAAAQVRIDLSKICVLGFVYASFRRTSTRRPASTA